MVGAGGFALSRSHGGDRFYNPPAMRRRQQMLLLKQQQLSDRQLQHLLQLQRPTKLDAGNRTESDDSVTTLSQPPTIASSCPPGPPPTNLDRLLASVTPFVTTQCFSEVKLYIDPLKPHSWLRRPGDESDAEASRENSSGGSSECEVDKQSKSTIDGLWNPYNLVNSNTQPPDRLSLRESSITISSSDEAENCNSPGQLLFEYLEQEQPRNREPLIDKISVLASQFPELRKLRSCNLLPASWISVAWYPIYRIPIGSTMRNLDASFLTFHCLSTRSKCNAQQPVDEAAGQKVHGFVDAASKMSLPVFGLASYKWRGSILTPCGPHECEQENFLLQAADNWLQGLRVGLPDYQFFRAHYSQWR